MWITDGLYLTYEQALNNANIVFHFFKDKGYKIEDNGKSPIIENSSNQKESCGVLPQLLNEISEDELESYLTNPEFGAQEKYDGRNRILIRFYSRSSIYFVYHIGTCVYCGLHIPSGLLRKGRYDRLHKGLALFRRSCA